MGDMIFLGDGRLCDVVVPEPDRGGCYEGLGELGDHQLAVIVFQGDTHAPTVFAAKITGFVAPRLGVDNHVDVKGTKWRGAVIKLFSCKEVPRWSDGI